MDRRVLTVLGASLVFALVVSSIFYQLVAGGKRPRTPPKAPVRDVVVAARALPPGVSLRAEDLKIGKVAEDQFPKGGFSRIEEVVERPVISSILAEEPIREGRLAQRGSGSGLAPMIPEKMRAVSVRVNEVVGVAGFVLPGMRVDVLVTGKPTESSVSVTRTVLQDILVLSAGPNIEPDARGQAINAPVVTLMVTPEQAETLTLASENRIQLVLRNSNDRALERTPGRDMAELFGRPVKPPPPRTIVKTVAPPPAPPPPPVDEVVIIRGVQRTVEPVGVRNPS